MDDVNYKIFMFHLRNVLRTFVENSSQSTFRNTRDAMAMFGTFIPIFKDGVDTYGRRSKDRNPLNHQTLVDCSRYLDRLLHCLDSIDSINTLNDYHIVIGMPLTHVFGCKDCQIILALKLYKYIKTRSFLKPPNGGRVAVCFGSKGAMVLSQIYVISKLLSICFYRWISASYLFEQYNSVSYHGSDGTFAEALCGFVIFAATNLMQYHEDEDWQSIDSPHGDLSPFGMAMKECSRFLYLFAMHCGKMLKPDVHLGPQMRGNPTMTVVTNYFWKNGDESSFDIGTREGLLECFGMHLDMFNVVTNGYGFDEPEPICKYMFCASLRAVKCQWKRCRKRNRFDKGREKFKKCGNCKVVRYCSVRCQKLDWNRGSHKQICFCLSQSLQGRA